MDLYTILLIIFFVVIPLIQQVLEKRKGELPPPDLDERIEPQRRPSPATRGDGWSGEWGEWPSQPEEDEVQWEPWQAEPRDSPPAPAPQPTAAPRPAPAPAPPPEAPPEPLWQQARVEVKREERPVFIRPDTSRVVSLEDVEASSINRPRRAPSVLAAPPGHRRRGTRAERLIRSRNRLRAAVILSEVLGPPRSMRPPIEDRG